LQRFESLLLTPATILGTPAEAGLNQKWRSQKDFKPCDELCNLFTGHNTITYFKNLDGILNTLLNTKHEILNPKHHENR
jgi:hypothetical protein